MDDMEKKSHKLSLFEWKNFKVCIIVMLLFSLTMVYSAVEDEAVKPEILLQEAQVVREANQRHVLDLEVELARTRKELDEARARYADLYLDSRDVVERLRGLEMQAAHLLQQRSDEEYTSLLAQVLEALQTVRDRQIEVEQALKDFEMQIGTLLDVLQPSDAMRREVQERLDTLRGAVERSLNPLSIVARRGSERDSGKSCRVLAVKDELRVVVLDGGSLDGVRPGSGWHASKDGEVIVRLKVLEVRPDISAALVTEGAFGTVVPGMKVEPDRP